MRKNPSPEPDFVARQENVVQSAGVVGHLLLGDRVFNIALASDDRCGQPREELSRFEFLGHSLVVFEATDTGLTPTRNAADDLASRLSGRELQITVMVAQGYATKNIAYILNISEWTVGTYLRRIFAKLNVDSRAAMVYRCAPLIDRTADACACAKRGGHVSSPLGNGMTGSVTGLSSLAKKTALSRGGGAGGISMDQKGEADRGQPPTAATL